MTDMDPVLIFIVIAVTVGIGVLTLIIKMVYMLLLDYAGADTTCFVAAASTVGLIYFISGSWTRGRE